MASGRSSFETPDQPNRNKRRAVDLSPNLNLVYSSLADLTPPRKNKYTDQFTGIGTLGASPSVTEFGFPRVPDSSSSPFRTNDAKSDAAFDMLGPYRSTPLQGRSPILDFSSPRSGAHLNPPPVPIFQPSPRRPSDASTYISPESKTRRSSMTSSEHANLGAFTFASPRPRPTPTHGSIGGIHASTGMNVGANTTYINHWGQGHTSFTSGFASILGDSHSRISPTNLSKVAAAARDGSAIRSHFGGLFTTTKTTALGDTHNHNIKSSSTQLVPIENDSRGTMSLVGMGVRGAADENGDPHLPQSPTQLNSSGLTPPRALALLHPGSSDAIESHGDGDEGYEEAAARRPNRRRALDFDKFDKYQNIHSNPLSPVGGPVMVESIEALLPIPRLRNGGDVEDDIMQPPGKQHTRNSGSTDPNHTASGAMTTGDHTKMKDPMSTMYMESVARSPISMRPGIIRREDIIDSPAVKEATDAAVARALQANAERRPSRAAAAGAAAAAAAAAGGIAPMARRPSSSSAATATFLGSNGLSSLTPSASIVDANGQPIFNDLGDPANGGPIKCNCKKSRCMKLYCDCFKALGYCGEGCLCVGCSNRESNTDSILLARESILARNPHAFTEKIVEAPDGVDGGGGGVGGSQHRRGCNCKKSKCLKKYCECYQAGIACGDTCKCEGCHNTTDNIAAGIGPFADRQKQQGNDKSNLILAGQQQQLISGFLNAAMTSSGEEKDGSGDTDSGGGDANKYKNSSNGNAAVSETINLSQTTPRANTAPSVQAFAALGPAFQQILIQRVLNNCTTAATTAHMSKNGNNANNTRQNSVHATAAVTASPGSGPSSDSDNGKKVDKVGNGNAAVTVNNQVLVPLSWGLGTPNAAAQQIINLAATGAIPGLNHMVAAVQAAAKNNNNDTNDNIPTKNINYNVKNNTDNNKSNNGSEDGDQIAPHRRSHRRKSSKAFLNSSFD